MATNKEKVYKFVQRRFLADQTQGTDQGVQTSEVAKYLDIKRPNVSALLNQLVKEGTLTKTKTRPVRYHLSDKITHTAFDDLIGAQGSLSEAIKQAKAAINYPGGPLPMQVTGNLGDGVSSFVKKCVEYAQEKNIISQDVQYHRINCMINNDQEYLNKNLFGDDSSENYLNKHDHQIIIIDHYEKLDERELYQLNTLLENSRKNSNWIILATTPDNKNQINLSIKILIPGFLDRPLEEKLAVVERSFESQAKNSGKQIIVNSDLIVSLATHKYSHGFKSISKVITRASATAYLRSLDDQQDKIFVNEGDLPDTFVINKTLGLQIYQEVQRLTNNREKFIFKGDLVKDKAERLYQTINTQYQTLSDQGLTPSVIQQSVSTWIDNLFKQYGFHNVTNTHHDKEIKVNELSKLVPQNIITLTQNFLNLCEKRLNHQFNSEIFYGLCLHLNSMINLGISSHYRIKNISIDQIQEKDSLEFELVKEFSKQIKDVFHYECDKDEQAVIVMFLIEPKANLKHPVVLYAMHGNGAAHYLSETTNQLDHTNNTFSYDMQLDKDLEQVHTELRNLVTKIDQGKGVIVIYDMGSFKDLFNRISDETGIAIRLINFPITLMGLELARKVMTNDNIDDIYHGVLSNIQNLNATGLTNKQNMFITLCHTGEGGAVQLKDYIEQYSHLGYVVKAMSISDRDALAKNVQKLRKIYNICAFIGTYNPNLFGIPFISITRVFENSLENLDKVLSFVPINTKVSIYNKIYSYYETELKYVSVDALKETMPQVMDMLSAQYQLSEDQQIGVLTHIVGIIENGLAGKKREKVNISDSEFQRLKNDFIFLEKALHSLEKKFNFIFNDSDLYTITAILKKLS